MTVGGLMFVILAVGGCVNHGRAKHGKGEFEFRGSANERPTKRGCNQKQNEYRTPLTAQYSTV